MHDPVQEGPVLRAQGAFEEAWKSAGTILPMGFDVIVRGDSGRSAEANVAGWLEEHHAALRGRLQALRGRVEVGVQILRDAEDVTVSEAGEAGTAQARPRGRAYFARHQLRREQRERLERAVEADSRRHCGMLATLADGVQVNGPRPVRGKVMMLNVALLAGQAGVRRVGDYLEQVSREEDTEVRFTGPWPPYSFTGTFGKLEKSVE